VHPYKTDARTKIVIFFQKTKFSKKMHGQNGKPTRQAHATVAVRTPLFRLCQGKPRYLTVNLVNPNGGQLFSSGLSFHFQCIVIQVIAYLELRSSTQFMRDLPFECSETFPHKKKKNDSPERFFFNTTINL
jgi:hypothetical protein